MGWTVFAEVSGPFEWLPRVERSGAMRRYHWLWFSWGTINGTFNDMMEAIHRCASDDPEWKRAVDRRLTKST